MDEFVRQVGLGFELPEGGFQEERVVVSGLDMPSLLAEAQVFGRHAEFGRTFLGLTGHIARLDELYADGETSFNRLLETSADPHLSADAMAEFLATHEVSAIPEIDEYDTFDALGQSFFETGWWQTTAAYGTATTVGIDLQRCCAADPAFAGAAAFAVFDAILHQGTVFPATVVAMPFVVELLLDERILCRRVLASGVLKIVETVETVPQGNVVREAFERVGSGILKAPPFQRDDLVDSMRRHVDAARAIRKEWPKLAVQLSTVADDKALGQSVRKALELLSVDH
jgi:hypothetical protein